MSPHCHFLFRETWKVGIRKIQILIIARKLHSLTDNFPLINGKDILLVGQDLKNLLNQSLRLLLDIELILDHSRSLIHILTHEVNIVDIGRQLDIESNQQVYSFSWAEVQESDVIDRLVEEGGICADDSEGDEMFVAV